MNDLLHKWIHIMIENGPQYLAFTYLDPDAGPSARGTVARAPITADHVHRALNEPESTVRLVSWGDRLRVLALNAEQIEALDLPKEPPWLHEME